MHASPLSSGKHRAPVVGAAVVRALVASGHFAVAMEASLPMISLVAPWIDMCITWLQDPHIYKPLCRKLSLLIVCIADVLKLLITGKRQSETDARQLKSNAASHALCPSS